MTVESDVVILGGGPAGYSCALRCSDLGLSVTLVESDAVGGTCLHRGCVPTRAMLEAAAIADAAARRGRSWGLSTAYEGVDMQRLAHTRDRIVGLNQKAVVRHLEGASVRTVQARGELVGPREVLAGGERIRARRAVVLAVGSRPKHSSRLRADGQRILTSDHVFDLDRVPRSMLVLGGGAIGAEFSQLWRALGAEVTLVEREAHLVPFEDEDVGRTLGRALRRQGVGLLEGAHVQDVNLEGDECRVTFEVASGMKTVEAQVVVLAIGRDAALDGIGIENTSVRTDAGSVQLKSWDTLETDEPGIYAVGDILPAPSHGRAHVAYAEGMLVADRIGGSSGAGIDYKHVPRITHGLVETACIGSSEKEARSNSEDVHVATMPIGAVAKGAILGEPGLAKVVSDRSDTIVGIHLVGPQVSELMGEAAAIVDFEASPSDVAHLIHPHPTLSESIAEAHMKLSGKPLHLR